MFLNPVHNLSEQRKQKSYEMHAFLNWTQALHNLYTQIKDNFDIRSGSRGLQLYLGLEDEISKQE